MSTDQDSILLQLFEQINAAHFAGKLTGITIDWGIPKLLDITSNNHFDHLCLEIQKQIKNSGINYLITDSCDALIYAANCQNRIAKEIIQHVLVQLEGQAPEILRKFTEKMNSISLRFSYAKPESICRDENGNWKISIHEQLEKSRTPLYVMKYLIHHACLHTVFKIETTPDYPVDLIELDRFIPDRKRALIWLRNAKYFTLFD